MSDTCSGGSKKPRLLQINECLNLSTGNIAQACIDVAVQNGWDCYFAFSAFEPVFPSNAKLIKVGNKWNTYLHYAENFIFDREGLSSRLVTRHFIEEIKMISPDVVHLHSLHDHWINYKLLFEYLNKTNIKVVWTLHDFWPVTGHCMHFVKKNCDRWQTGCYSCPMQKEYPYSIVDCSKRNWMLKKRLFTENKNLTVVPVSDWVGEVLRQSFLKTSRILVINNGIDTNAFKPTEIAESSETSEQSLRFQGQTKGKFVIMAVASEWKTGKGLEDYVAMSMLLKEDELIVLVGVSDDIINSLPSNVLGLKRTSGVRELASYYTRADVVCSFSEAETFGLTIAEANACGTPVVVYNNTAQPYLVTPSTGIVVKNSDYRGAYEAIQKIKVTGKNSYSDACINLAKTQYSKKQCFAKYIELYNSLL